MTQTGTEVQSNLDWVIGKEDDKGIKVDLDAPTYPWMDLIGLVQPDTSSPTLEPSLETFVGSVKAYEYDLNDELHAKFHIPHDWVLGHDARIHMHWAHNGTAISGTMAFSVNAMYADRDTGIFSAKTLDSITVATPDIATIPQYQHFVTEVDLTTSGGSSTTLDSDDIEVDGIIAVSFKMTAEPNITAGHLFMFTSDVHYQSTGVGTKNNASPFYT